MSFYDSDDRIYDCIIIGGGASGLMCAAAFSYVTKGLSQDGIGKRGAGRSEEFRGLIIEKTGRTGTKLLMSGGGHCNITHSGSIKDFISKYGAAGRTLRSALYKWNNLSLISFLESNGVATFSNEEGRVFPSSMKAADVLSCLRNGAGKSGFSILTGLEVTGISRENGHWKVLAGSDPGSSGSCVHHARDIVIATGGASYPGTGSDGSFFEVLRNDLGLSVKELRPALSPLRPADYPYSDLAGISLENAAVSVEKKGVPVSQGPLLFTHKELSGPAVLNISKNVSEGDAVRINYIHPVTFEEAFSRLSERSANSRSELFTIASEEFDLPRRFTKALTKRSGASLKKLAQLLTGERFVVEYVCGFERAMVTSGGVALSDIDARTMGLAAHPHCFVIGEALDCDGPTGGYNLQLCWSTACAAAASILKGKSEPSK